MKTEIISLIGDPKENLYQLGLREKEAFLKLEARVSKLLSTNFFLRHGLDVVGRARIMMKKKKEDSFFDQCIHSYAEGLGIDPLRYFSFLSLFEYAAHHGQAYPELKGILPGCSSVFAKTNDEFTHSRLLDFPLVGIYDKFQKFYYWQIPGKQPLLTMSCEGMAPLFFQGIHGGGFSFALHHKPGHTFHHEGHSIFQVAFETLFECTQLNDFKKELKKKSSMTKWAFLLLDHGGTVVGIDIDGPSQISESFHLNDNSPLIFTNIPLQTDASGFESYLKFSEDRQWSIKNKLSSKKNAHILDLMTDISDSKAKNWRHPGATLSTVGAYHINLTKGYLDVKEGTAPMTPSDAIIRINLADHKDLAVIKEKQKESPFEMAWKRAAKAQGMFDQGEYDLAYHELQMAISLMPHAVWKDIFSFYLYVWDFKFLTNMKELSLVYKKAHALKLPALLNDQWCFLIMRMEKKLDLHPTINFQDVSPTEQRLFQEEKSASKPKFATWMKLLYPRMEILDVFSPHQK